MSLMGSRFPFTGGESVPRVVVEALGHRAELASLEFEEAKRHGAMTVILTALAWCLLLLAGFTATFALAASVWTREDRGLILSCVALAYLVAAVSLGLFVIRRIRTWVAFPDTCKQFLEDCACIHELATAPRQ